MLVDFQLKSICIPDEFENLEEYVFRSLRILEAADQRLIIDFDAWDIEHQEVFVNLTIEINPPNMDDQQLEILIAKELKKLDKLLPDFTIDLETFSIEQEESFDSDPNMF